MNGEDQYDFAFQLEELDGVEFNLGHRWAELRGIGPRPSRPLHEYWTAVAIRAVDTMNPNDDPPDWYDLKTQVYVKHSSPGWIDGFRVAAG
jgi:hypothetical protein